MDQVTAKTGCCAVRYDKDQIKQASDIVDVISSVIELKKKGKDHWAECPFHTEKTGSFSVSSDKQMWYCFGGCGQGGDVIAFVQKYFSLDFNGALGWLARKYGIEGGTVSASVSDEIRKRRLKRRRRAVFEDWKVRYTGFLATFIRLLEDLYQVGDYEELRAVMVMQLQIWGYHRSILIGNDEWLKYQLYLDTKGVVPGKTEGCGHLWKRRVK